MAQPQRSATQRRKEVTGGKDESIFFVSTHPLPVETVMRSGDHPVRPVREEPTKKNERTAFSFLSLPKIWDIFAS